MVPPFYDSLLAKLIVTGADRAEAVGRLRRALAGCEIGGVATNLPLLAALAGDAGFAAGGVDTGFLARLAGRTPAVARWLTSNCSTCPSGTGTRACGAPPG